MKKFFKILLITIVTLLVLLLVAPVLFKGKIIALVNEQLEKNLHAKASFSDISLSFFRDIPNSYNFV